MSNYNSFVFDGHGTSELDGSYDPGAMSQGAKENDLVKTINKYTKEFLNKTSLTIHYDEQNFKDKDLLGNKYSSNGGISVHINAGGGSGVEGYVPLNEKYLQFEVELLKDLSACMGIPNRGIRSRDYNSGNTIQRSNGVGVGGTDYYKEIRDAWGSGISLTLLEVGFIDTSDLFKIQSNARRIGYYIAKYICGICGVSAPSFEGSNSPSTSLPPKPSPPIQYGEYKVKIVNNAIYVLNGPSSDYDIVQTIYKNEVYTIIEVKNGYGKLKSGAGWINMSYTTRV